MLPLIWLVLALSIDGFNVGITYGLRKIYFPAISFVIFGLCSGSVLLFSLHLGKQMNHFLPSYAAHYVGSLLLISIGLWSLIQAKWPPQQEIKVTNTINPSLNLQSPSFFSKIRSLPHKIFTIFNIPTEADVDHSGSISVFEAILLSFALSIDSFGVGLGSAIIVDNPLLLSGVIAVTSPLFLKIGISTGYQLCSAKWTDNLSYLPGIVLIMIGVIRLL